MPFKNDHLSVSRLQAYEQCPRQFAFRYIDRTETGEKIPVDPDVDWAALEYGKAEHKTLEDVYNWAVAIEFEGIVPETIFLEYYRKAFAESQCKTLDVFQYGVSDLRRFFQVPIDYSKVLGVEEPIDVTWGDFKLVGYMDRVDIYENPKRIEVIDYKTNRLPYSEDETNNSLQAHVYAADLLDKHKDIEKIGFSFSFLRLGFSKRI